MKVKIIQCSQKYYWYRDRIGEIFDVSRRERFFNSSSKIGKLDVYVIDNTKFILIEDTISTRQLKLERILK